MDRIIRIKKEQKIWQGIVMYEEGELIEATFDDDPEVTAGEQLSCLVTSDYETFWRLQGVVVARDKNRLFLFCPPTPSEFREQRRHYPRFDMESKAWLHFSCPKPDESLAGKFMMVDLLNLSLGGMAFRSEKPVPLEVPLSFSAELYGRNRPDGVITGKVQLIHEHHKPPYYLYGGKFIEMPSRYFHNLRKYLLLRQLEERWKPCED